MALDCKKAFKVVTAFMFGVFDPYVKLFHLVTYMLHIGQSPNFDLDPKCPSLGKHSFTATGIYLVSMSFYTLTTDQ